MKKLRYSRRAVRSQEQPAPLETSIFAEQQAMAKTGTITAPSGSDAVIKALGDAAPVQNTLGGIVRDALSAKVGNGIAVINVARRTVTIVPAGTSLGTLESGREDQISVATFDDPTKATGPMTATNESADSYGAAVAAIPEATKPSLSVESFINRVEDVVLDEDNAFFGGDKSVLIVVDQANEEVRVHVDALADLEALDPSATLAEEAHFVQTLVNATGRQFGE